MNSETLPPYSQAATASLLTTVDWNEEWKSLQTARHRSDDASSWDARAKTFPVKHGSQQGYVGRFLELAGAQPGETVLDMGCGTGALATPLAQAGCKVVARDFSQGMLDVMVADQARLGITTVDFALMSWSDDWERFGLSADSVDVALASRSIATNDLQESLLKLHCVARRRVCITLPFGPSPKTDPAIVAAAGLKHRVGHDFLYAFNILVANGIAPEVAYIDNTRLELFSSFDEALQGFTAIVREGCQGIATADELAAVPDNLRPWLEENLVQDGRGFHLKTERNVRWAFISWNKA